MKKSSSLLAMATAGVIAAYALLFTSGCATGAPVAGPDTGAVYTRGHLNASLSHDYDRVVTAVNRAVDQLGFIKASEKKDARVATIISGNAAAQKIEIRIENAGENLTQVSIHVGVLGEEEASGVILDKIKANL